jgi:hypothetical protein
MGDGLRTEGFQLSEWQELLRYAELCKPASWALYALGFASLFGVGNVKKDRKKGQALLQEAANQNHALAVAAFADCLYENKPSDPKALQLYKKSEHSRAFIRLAESYHEQGDSAPPWSQGSTNGRYCDNGKCRENNILSTHWARTWWSLLSRSPESENIKFHQRQ